MLVDYITEHLLFWIFISILIITVCYLILIALHSKMMRAKRKFDQRIREKIKSIIHGGVKKGNKSVLIPLIHKNNLILLLKCIQELDQELGEKAAWKQIKQDIAKKYLLPQARIWEKLHIRAFRLYAAHSFAIGAEPSDHTRIEKLIRDRHATIRLHAVRAALFLEEPTLLKSALTQMSKEKESLWWMFKKIFEKRAKFVQALIKKEITKQEEPKVRAAYLYCMENPTVNEKDLTSTDSLLRKIAWKIYSSSKTKKESPSMKKIVSDQDPEIRKYVYQAAAHSDRTFLKKGLEDPEWDVRIFVARLMKGSQEGKKQLETASKSKCDAAQYALADPTI